MLAVGPKHWSMTQAEPTRCTCWAICRHRNWIVVYICMYQWSGVNWGSSYLHDRRAVRSGAEISLLSLLTQCHSVLASWPETHKDVTRETEEGLVKDEIFARTGNRTRDSWSKVLHTIHQAIASWGETVALDQLTHRFNSLSHPCRIWITMVNKGGLHIFYRLNGQSINHPGNKSLT